MSAIYVNIKTLNLAFTFLDLKSTSFFYDFDGQKLQVEISLNFFRSKLECQKI